MPCLLQSELPLLHSFPCFWAFSRALRGTNNSEVARIVFPNRHPVRSCCHLSHCCTFREIQDNHDVQIFLQPLFSPACMPACHWAAPTPTNRYLRPMLTASVERQATLCHIKGFVDQCWWDSLATSHSQALGWLDAMLLLTQSVPKRLSPGQEDTHCM